MSDRTIASRPSLEQVVAIVNFMEKHPTLAMGQLRGQEGRELSNSLWHQLTQTVNAIPGPSRPMKSWVKYWADKKSTIRQKVQANGDDPDSLSSNIDRKVWDLFVSPIPYKGPRSFKKEAYIQETYFRDEEEEEKEEEEDSMDQNKEAEPVILEFEEPVVDFEERQAAVMEKLIMERTTLGEIIKWQPPPDEDEHYRQLIAVVDEFYPDDWKNWEINKVTYEDLFGEKISPEEECHLRFAIPTVQLARALHNGPLYALSERKFKSMKRKLLSWPIGRALIYHPIATMKKVHPDDAYNNFVLFVPQIKAELISRPEASNFLRAVAPEDCKAPWLRKRKASTSSKDGKIPKSSEEQDDALSSHLLENFLEVEMTGDKNTSAGEQSTDPDSQREDRNSDDDTGEVASTAAGPGSDALNDIVGEEQSEVPILNIAQETKESESKTSVPDEEEAHFPRLGVEAWQNSGSPVFTSLEVNSILVTATPISELATELEKMDLFFGTITQKLIKQRQELQRVYDEASEELKPHIRKYILSPDTEFRKNTDALLQYTCESRDEIIQQRRELYKPADKRLYELLQSILPSSTHLFSEPQLSELVNEHGGIGKFFPPKPRNPSSCFKTKPRTKKSFTGRK